VAVVPVAPVSVKAVEVAVVQAVIDIPIVMQLQMHIQFIRLLWVRVAQVDQILQPQADKDLSEIRHPLIQ
jgi:hypothetical protein